MAAHDGKVVSLTGAFNQWATEALSAANLETIFTSPQGLEGLQRVIQDGIVQQVEIPLSAIQTAIAGMLP